jgi:hypothetical protein
VKESDETHVLTGEVLVVEDPRLVSLREHIFIFKMLLGMISRPVQVGAHHILAVLVQIKHDANANRSRLEDRLDIFSLVILNLGGDDTRRATRLCS